MLFDNEEELLKVAALRNALAVQKARGQVEKNLMEAKEELERQTGLLADSLATMEAALNAATREISARKQAEIALKASEERFHRLTEAMPQLVWTADAQGLVNFLNRPWSTYTGLSYAESMGHGWKGAIHPDDREVARGVWLKASATGTGYTLEIRLRRADGVFQWWLIRGAPLPGASDAELQWIGTCTDIDELKLALSQLTDTSRELNRQQAEMRVLFDLVPAMIWFKDTHNNVLRVNRLAAQEVAKTVAEVEGRPMAELYPSLAEKFYAGDLEIIRTGQPDKGRVEQITDVHGNKIWLQKDKVPCFDHDGTVIGIVVMSVDITERVRVLDALTEVNASLKAQQERTRVILENSNDAFIAIDQDGRVIEWNARAKDTFGWTAGEARGQLVSELIIPPDQRKAHHTGIARFKQTGTGPVINQRLEVTALHKDGHTFSAELSIRADLDNETYIAHAFMRDISERKRDQDALIDLNSQLELRVTEGIAEANLARQDAELANQAKSEFLAAMSHEIRTPMNGLFGLMELLGQSSLSPEQRDTLTAARESGKALLHIMDDILDFSKIEAHRLELNLAPGSVGNVVTSSHQLYETVAVGKKLEFHWHVAPEVAPSLLFDAMRLRQVLNNLISNAIKFTEKGKVQLRVELANSEQGRQQLRFIVSDTGIGISTEQLGRLFKPFVQASSDISGQFGGTGLGLSISRQLAEMMGGTLTAESMPGCGTTMTFLVEFDVCHQDGDYQQSGPAPLEGRTPLLDRPQPTLEEALDSGMLILVVDDHPTNRLVLVRQLALLGYRAETAVDGVDALQACERGAFGAILTDCNMPRMDGFELATAVRKLEHDLYRPRAPIIACTANALPSAVTACLDAGMDDYLVKPVTLAGLRGVLERWLPHSAPPEPPPAAANLEAPVALALDPSVLAEFSGGSAEIQSEILAEYRRVNALDVPTLRRAVEAAQLDQVRHFAHRIKGSSAMVGAVALANACARLEDTAAGSGNQSRLSEAFGNFELELQRLNKVLDGFSASNTT